MLSMRLYITLNTIRPDAQHPAKNDCAFSSTMARGRRRAALAALAGLLVCYLAATWRLVALESGKHASIQPSMLEPHVSVVDTQHQPQHRLLLHVGPPKTASTTLQHDLRDLQPFLEQDNTIYLGHWRGLYPDRLQELLRTCPAVLGPALEAGQAAENVTCYQDFQYYLHRQENRSIILSEELFAGIHMSTSAKWMKHLPIMKSYFVDLIRRDRRMTVVAIYRRYFAWIVSAKKQWDVKTCLGDAPRPGQWPSRGGRRCRSVWSALVSNTDQFTQLSTAFGYESPYRVLQPWRDMSVETALINLHDPNKPSVTEQIVCGVVDNLPSTCAAVQAQKESRKANQLAMESFAYDWIGVEAAERGLVDLARLRSSVAEELLQHHQQHHLKLRDLPLDCPTRSDVQILLDQSLAIEHELFPACNDDEAHQRAFWDMYERGDLCTPQADVLLKGTASWADLLQRLTRSYTSRNVI